MAELAQCVHFSRKKNRKKERKESVGRMTWTQFKIVIKLGLKIAKHARLALGS